MTNLLTTILDCADAVKTTAITRRRPQDVSVCSRPFTPHSSDLAWNQSLGPNVCDRESWIKLKDFLTT
jgi:hypothetical protein